MMDDVSQWWSWGLAAIGVLGLYLTTKKLAVGFAVGVAVQGLWIAFALASGQLGFIASAIAYGSVNALGLYRWTRNTPKPVGDIPTTKVSQETITLPAVNLSLIDSSGAFSGQAEATRRHFEEKP